MVRISGLVGLNGVRTLSLHNSDFRSKKADSVAADQIKRSPFRSNFHRACDLELNSGINLA